MIRAATLFVIAIACLILVGAWTFYKVVSYLFDRVDRRLERERCYESDENEIGRWSR